MYIKDTFTSTWLFTQGREPKRIVGKLHHGRPFSFNMGGCLVTTLCQHNVVSDHFAFRCVVVYSPRDFDRMSIFPSELYIVFQGVQEECGHFALFMSLDKGKIDAKTSNFFSSDSKSASKFMLRNGPNSTKYAKPCGVSLWKDTFGTKIPHDRSTS